MEHWRTAAALSRDGKLEKAKNNKNVVEIDLQMFNDRRKRLFRPNRLVANPRKS